MNGGGLANKLTMKLVLHILKSQASLFNCNKWKNYKRETNGSQIDIYYEKNSITKTFYVSMIKICI